jgi:two-component system, NarL family, sensor histidine kinase BarA
MLPSVSRLSAIDEPVELEKLLDRDNLQEVLRSFAGIHGVRVAVLDLSGATVASAGPDPGSADGDECFSEPLHGTGDPLGRVEVGPLPAADAARGPALAAHIAEVLGVLLHTAYARHLTATAHVEAIEESFAELCDKKDRLESALGRLKEVDRLKSSFLSTISHELRTPLTSVIGYAEMLLEGLAGDVSEDQKDFLRTILEKADQLLQLITGILDVSLIEARSLRIKKEPVSLAEVIEAVAIHLDSEARRRGVALGLPRGAVPRALVDRRKIRQVFLHLFANAINFSPDGGNVAVELDVGPLSAGDTASVTASPLRGDLSRRFGLRVRVRDGGIGIPAEEQQRIFEPFFQVDSSSTREYGGTGLGLCLAKNYVEAHGGSIWVESSPGAGSIFTVTLPAVPDELEAFAAVSPPPGPR